MTLPDELLPLPDELWRRVMEYFTGEDLARAAQVTSLWHERTESFESFGFWKSAAMHAFPHLQSTKDASAYSDDWKRLVQDHNRCNRSFATNVSIALPSLSLDRGSSQFQSESFSICGFTFHIKITCDGETSPVYGTLVHELHFPFSSVSLIFSWKLKNQTTQKYSIKKCNGIRMDSNTMHWSLLLRHDQKPLFCQRHKDTLVLPVTFTLVVTYLDVLVYDNDAMQSMYTPWPSIHRDVCHTEPSFRLVVFPHESWKALERQCIQAFGDDRLYRVWMLTDQCPPQRLIVDNPNEPMWTFVKDHIDELRRIRLWYEPIQKEEELSPSPSSFRVLKTWTPYQGMQCHGYFYFQQEMMKRFNMHTEGMTMIDDPLSCTVMVYPTEDDMAWQDMRRKERETLLQRIRVTATTPETCLNICQTYHLTYPRYRAFHNWLNSSGSWHHVWRDLERMITVSK